MSYFQSRKYNFWPLHHISTQPLNSHTCKDEAIMILTLVNGVMHPHKLQYSLHHEIQMQLNWKGDRYGLYIEVKKNSRQGVIGKPFGMYYVIVVNPCPMFLPNLRSLCWEFPSTVRIMWNCGPNHAMCLLHVICWAMFIYVTRPSPFAVYMYNLWQVIELSSLDISQSFLIIIN